LAADGNRQGWAIPLGKTPGPQGGPAYGGAATLHREGRFLFVSSIFPRPRRRPASDFWPPIVVVVIVLSMVTLTLTGTAAAAAAGAVGTAGLAAAEVVRRLQQPGVAADTAVS